MELYENGTDVFVPPVAEKSDFIQIGYNAACIAIGFPLNLITLHRLFQLYRTSRSRIFLLHLNMNVSDLMVLAFYCFGRVCWLTTYEWLGGDILCRLMRFLEAFSFAISSNVVVCIALDRLHSVLRPLNASQRVTYRVWISIGLAWLLALVTSVPQLIVYQTWSPPGTNWTQCLTYWVVTGTLNSTSSLAYQISHVLTLFWIPVAVLLISYALILREIFVMLRNEEMPEQSALNYSNNSPNHHPQLSQRVSSSGSVKNQRNKVRTLRITLILVTIYIVCWLPYNSLALWSSLAPNSYSLHEDNVYILISLVVLNSVVNPIIYGRLTLTKLQYGSRRRKLQQVQRVAR